MKIRLKSTLKNKPGVKQKKTRVNVQAERLYIHLASMTVLLHQIKAILYDYVKDEKEKALLNQSAGEQDEARKVKENQEAQR